MKYRGFNQQDLGDVLALFKVVFGSTMDERTWRWFYMDKPFGEGIIMLCFDNNKLVGHYAVVPTALWYDNEAHMGAFSMTTMTHPDYAGKGIFTKLANETYSICKEVGIKSIFGFPNSNSYYGFTRKLGWSGFGEIDALRIECSPVRLQGADNLLATQMTRADGRIEKLWKRSVKPASVTVPRTYNFFEWRYFTKPGDAYFVFSFEDAGGELSGVLVLKLYSDATGLTGHIVDVMTIDCPGACKTMLNCAFEFFHANGAKRISAWVPGKNLIKALLVEAGFTPSIWPTYFGVKPLEQKSRLVNAITNRSQWDITMGDSDVF